MGTKLLICTVGLPRSGKTTWAYSTGYPIVSPDAIRLALHGRRYVQLAEPYVWAIAKTMVSALFLAGHKTVVLDATCSTRKRRDDWQGHKWSTQFKVIQVHMDVCVQRAMDDDDSEIIPVIQRMFNQWERLADDEVEYTGD